MKLRVPHPWALLAALVVIAAAATWLLPAGEYTRIEVDGKRIVDPASFREVERRPAGIGEVFLAYPRGLAATASIVFFIFLIGGAFGVLNATGALEAGIGAIVSGARGRGELVIPLLVLVFAIGGGTIGMAEEVLPFLPGLVVLCRRLGYDELVAGAIAFGGAGAGFAGAFLNPFTVGVAHGIAGLPLFSGMGFRVVVWATLTAATIVYVVRYARRCRVPPEEIAALAAVATIRLDLRRRLVLVALAAGLVFVVVGSVHWGWGLLELSALFLALALAAALCGGLGADKAATSFIDGAAGMASAALVVGLARGVLVILDGARTTDAILHSLAGVVAGLPGFATAFGIYGVQVLLSYLVPSASGQAALSLPILLPLGELVGVTRQTSVLAYQFGDGFSNVFSPTSGFFMAGLGLLGIDWPRWARFMAPLQVIWLAIGLVALAVAQAIGYGPF